MIDLYFWPTPNGHKITIYLEEAKLPYRILPINISKGEQFAPEFLKISPNNRMPAIVDKKPNFGKKSISVFESGAILVYLAGKTGKFIPRDERSRIEVLEWVFWQMGGLGPMAGQNHHFGVYAPEKIEYAINRYVNETGRLYAVLDQRLKGRDFIVNRYSIADMICYPWVFPHKRQQQNLADFPYLNKWFNRIGNRSAVLKAYEKGLKVNKAPVVDEKSRRLLFGQSANTIRRTK